MSETTIAPRFEQLRPTSITPHEKNPRIELGDLTELTESIRGSGVLEPLIVAPTKGGRGRKFTLIAGHRRHAASLKAALKTVPCIIRDDLTEEREQLEVMLTENLHRSDLNAVEEGNAYQSLLEFDDVDLKGLAARTGHTQKTIRGRIALAKSPETVRAKLLAKDITLDDALAVAEFEDDPDTHGKLVTALGTYNFTHLIEYSRRQRQFWRDVAKERKQLEAAGITVFDNFEALAADEENSRTTDEPYEWVNAGDLDDDDRAKLTENGQTIVTASVPSPTAAEGNFGEYVRMPVVQDDDGDWINPAFNGGAARGPASLTPEQLQEKAEKEQAAAEMAAATAVRHRFVAGRLTVTPPDSLVIELLRAKLTKALNPDGWSFAVQAEVLGLPPRTRDDDDQYAAVVANHINRWDVGQLVLALTAAEASVYDRTMYGDRFGFRRAAEWRALLAALDYVPAPIEQTVIDEYTAANAAEAG